jgi:hypothetical protein
LFPKNTNFEKLINYKTPFNTLALRVLFVLFAGLLSFFSVLLGISLFCKNKTNAISSQSVVVMVTLNLLLVAYLAVLFTNKNIFYFDAPYKDYSSFLISTSSFIPFVLLVLIGPFIFQTIKKLKSGKTKIWTKTILVFNNLLYIFLIIGFAYWGLYNIWDSIK